MAFPPSPQLERSEETLAVLPGWVNGAQTHLPWALGRRAPKAERSFVAASPKRTWTSQWKSPGDSPQWSAQGPRGAFGGFPPTTRPKRRPIVNEQGPHLTALFLRCGLLKRTLTLPKEPPSLTWSCCMEQAATTPSLTRAQGARADQGDTSPRHRPGTNQVYKSRAGDRRKPGYHRLCLLALFRSPHDPLRTSPSP